VRLRRGLLARRMPVAEEHNVLVVRSLAVMCIQLYKRFLTLLCAPASPELGPDAVRVDTST
jgi:hypothetical protein